MLLVFNHCLNEADLSQPRAPSSAQLLCALAKIDAPLKRKTVPPLGQNSKIFLLTSKKR